jgi:hypothetical protein
MPLEAPPLEAPEIETDVHMDAGQNVLPRDVSSLTGEVQTQTPPIQPRRDEPPRKATRVPASTIRDQTTPAPKQDPNVVHPDHQDPLPGKEHEKRAPVQPNRRPPIQIENTSRRVLSSSPPALRHLSGSPNSDHKTRIDPSSVEPRGSRPIASRPEMGPVMEPRRRQRPDPALRLQDASSEQNDVRPNVAAQPVVPASQITVIRERVETMTLASPSRPHGSQPQLVPALPASERKPQPAMEESEPQTPTIHVTIGRIEIKAVTPGPTQKRGGSASATMSLDEYLRRRQGSER